MRKLMFLMLLLSGLSLVACGGDDDKGGNSDDDGADDNGDGDGDSSDDTEETTDPIGDGADDDSDDSDGIDIPDAGSGGGGGNIDVPELYPECTVRAMVTDPLGDWDASCRPVAPATTCTSPRPFSLADAMACAEMCGNDQNCWNDTNCPGHELWSQCVNSEITNCTASTMPTALSATGGKCRNAFTNLICCAYGKGCVDPATGELTSENCIELMCGTDQGAFQTCAEKDTACTGNDPNNPMSPVPLAQQSCLGTDMAAPTPSPAPSAGLGSVNRLGSQAINQMVRQAVKLTH